MYYRSPQSKKKTGKVKRFSKKDAEIASKLKNLGLKQNIAQILAYLRSIKSAESIDFEKAIFIKGQRHLFRWDNICGRDTGRLKKYIEDKFHIDWVKNAKIEKVDTDEAIKISTKNLFISIRLNDEKTKAELKFVKTNDNEITKRPRKTFTVKSKNSKLYIYDEGRVGKIQPQISNALIKLKDRGWIDEEEIKSNDHEILKFKKYKLKIHFDEIINQLEKEAMDKVQQLLIDNTKTSKNLAKIQAHLNVKEANSTELENNTGLSKFQIRHALKQLKSKNRDWINEIDEKKNRKGRPEKIYSLKISSKDIVAQLEKELMKNIEGLRKLNKSRKIGI